MTVNQGGAASAAPATETAAVDVEREIWEGARSIDTIEAFQGYLADYPNGRYAKLASAQVTKFKQSSQPAGSAMRPDAQAIAEAEKYINGGGSGKLQQTAAFFVPSNSRDYQWRGLPEQKYDIPEFCRNPLFIGQAVERELSIVLQGIFASTRRIGSQEELSEQKRVLVVRVDALRYALGGMTSRSDFNLYPEIDFDVSVQLEGRVVWKRSYTAKEKVPISIEFFGCSGLKSAAQEGTDRMIASTVQKAAKELSSNVEAMAEVFMLSRR